MCLSDTNFQTNHRERTQIFRQNYSKSLRDSHGVAMFALTVALFPLTVTEQGRTIHDAGGTHESESPGAAQRVNKAMVGVRDWKAAATGQQGEALRSTKSRGGWVGGLWEGEGGHQGDLVAVGGATPSTTARYSQAAAALADKHAWALISVPATTIQTTTAGKKKKKNE